MSSSSVFSLRSGCVLFLLVSTMISVSYAQSGGPYTFSGHVQRTSGEGVSGVTVAFSLLEGDGAIPVAVTTDEEGRFTQAGFSDGSTYRAEPYKLGWLFGPPRIEFDAETDNAFFIGRPPFSIFGKVTDGSGSGVSGVTLVFSLVTGTGGIPAAVTTDSEGSFSQSGFTNGAVYRVTPAKDALTFSPASCEFSIETAGDPMTFMLIAPFSLSGRVFDSWGQPVAGVEIVFSSRDDQDDAPPVVWTDAGGVWSQSGFSYGNRYVVSPQKPGYAFDPTHEVAAGPAENLNFTATPPYSVSGRVADELGAGIEGVKMRFSLTGIVGQDPWGCLAAYDFEGTCNDSVGDIDGVGNDIGFTEGPPGYSQAAYFYRDHSVVNIGSDPDIADLSRFTLSAWILPFSDGDQDSGRIYHKYSPAGGFIRFQVSSESAGTVGLFGQVVCESVPAKSFSATGMTLGQWHHVAMGWDDASKKVRLYIDGAEVTYGYQVAGAGAQSDDSEGSGCIGNDNAGKRRFDGYIDAFRIFDRLLDESEIAQLWGKTSTETVPPAVITGPNGNWTQDGFWGGCEYEVAPSKEGWGFDPTSQPFDEAATNLDFVAAPPYAVSGKVADSAGNPIEGVQLSFRRAVGETIDLPGCISAYEFEGSCVDRLGVNDGVAEGLRYMESSRDRSLAADFFQYDSAVTIGSNSPLDNLSTFTLTAWIRPRSDGGGETGKIFSKYSPAGGYIRLQVMYERSGGVHLYGSVACDSASAKSLSNLSSIILPLNAWRHVAMTWNDATKIVRLYVDGQEVPYNYQLPGSGEQGDDSLGDAYIGNETGGARAFDGYIDDFRIFNRSLTGAEIQQTMWSATSEDSPGPVKTGQDGRWTCSDFTGGCQYEVTPSKPGWGFVPQLRDFEAPANDVDFVATPPYSVSGRVTDPSGAGVAQVMLKFTSRTPGIVPPPPVATDENGDYLQGGFWGLCEYEVVAWKSGWGFDPVSRRFNGPSADQDFLALQPYSASGRIVDSLGNPVSGITISFVGPGRRGSTPPPAVTGDDGRWFQSGFSGGVAFVATPAKQGWVFDPVDRQFIAEAADQDFVALPPYAARGRVTDSAGNGIANVSIAFTTESTVWVPPSVNTDADGYWVQTGFASGFTYRAAPSKQSWSFEPKSRQFSEESTGQDFLGFPPYPLAGRLSDESGQGVEGVTVTFWIRSGNGFVPPSVVSGGNGSWSQSGFTPGVDYGVRFQMEGWFFDPSWVGFSGPQGDILVLARGPYAVSGRVTNTLGEGIEGVRIVFSPRAGTQRTPPSVTTSADGSWAQTGFDRGNTYWAVPSVRGTEFIPSYREFNGPETNITFMMGAPYGISGHVVDGQGKGVAGVEIVFRTESRSASVPPSAVTDDEGGFLQSGFSAGMSYRAVPHKAGWAFSPSSISFDSANSDLAFFASAPYAVSGRVSDGSGQGVADVKIVFASQVRSAAAPEPAITDGEGRFSQTGFWSAVSYTAAPEKGRWTFLPSVGNFNDAVADLFFEAHAPQAKLTVVSECGTPTPPRGESSLSIGSTVNAAVDPVVLEGTGTKHTCTGWVGSGSIPPSGTDSSLSFVLDQDSSLTWSWRTEFRLHVAASPEEGGGTLVVPEAEWYEKGIQVTISATPNPGYSFFGWSGDAAGRASSILLDMNQPRTIVARFSVDSDEDGLPDDWEIQYFGDLSEDGFGDPDQDDVPNSVEFTFDTDPSHQTPSLTVVMSECGANAAIEFPIIKNKVSVLGEDGDSVPGLAASDFVIWEDNSRQLPLEVSESGGGDVVSVALVLDNSGSMAGQPLDDSHLAADFFIDQMKPEDSAAIIKFGTTVSLVQQFTSDKNVLHSAVDTDYTGFGDTAFYSAVHRALHESIIRTGNRAIVALTDGIDNSSSHGLQQVTDYARRVGIPVYVVGLGSVTEDALIKLANDTGGRYYYAPDSSGLQGIYDEISRIAGNWYHADYETSNPDPNAPPYPRAVAVWAHFNGAVGRDDGEYEPPRENTPPLCHVETPKGEQQGDVSVAFQLLDFESDSCFVEVFYSVDGGWSWVRAALSAEPSPENLESSPQGVAHTVVWLSRENLPGSDEQHVRLKVVPYDLKKGTPAETEDFPLYNNTRPRVQIDTPQGLQQGNIPFAYRLVDAESDLCSVVVEYSLDGGAAWHLATRASGGDGEKDLVSSPEGTSHAFVWDSLDDMGYGMYDETMIRMGVSDSKAGQPGQTDIFAVNNIPPERLSFSPQDLSFVAHEGGQNPDRKSLAIWNSGGGTLFWRVESGSPWLVLSPIEGQSTGEQDIVTVQVNVAGISPGNYNSEIRIESLDGLGEPGIVPVTLTVKDPPALIVVSPGQFVFSAVAVDGDPTPQTLRVLNAGGGDMEWQAWVSAAWLSVTPDSGNSSGEGNLAQIVPHVAGLIPGNYHATITIVAPRASNTPRVIPVTLTLAQSYPRIAVQPGNLVFEADEGDGDPPAQAVEIWNDGGLTLSWQLQPSDSWIDVNVSSGVSTGEKDDFLVSVRTAGLSLGTYTGSITIAAGGATNSPLSIPVELRLKPRLPDLAVAPSQLSFTTGRGGPDPPSQEITISSNRRIEWQIKQNTPWIQVEPSQGTVHSGSCRVSVSATKSGLDLGTYQGHMVIEDVADPAARQEVAVTLTIAPIEIPSDYPTIQQGIEAAFDDDVVLVDPGTYRENLSVSKSVEIRSAAGPDATTIDGSGLGSVVSFKNTHFALLEGFTLINGTGDSSERPSPAGGGIYCRESSPVISQCHILGNLAAWGGGICVDEESSPHVIDSVIMGNMADDGAGIFCYDNTYARFTTTVIAGNTAQWFGGGACSIAGAKPSFEGCLFYANHADFSGGGIFISENGDVDLVSCTLADNYSEEGANILAEAGSSSNILNSLVWGDPGDLTLLGRASVQYSNISDPRFAGSNGNIMEEPVLFDPENGDYHILPTSPCIDNGSNQAPNLPETDLDGDPRILSVYDEVTTDMGADEHDPEMIFISVGDDVDVAADGDVTVRYTLWNAQSIACPVLAEYTKDGGRTWQPATSGGSGSEQMPTGAASSPNGQEHLFVWDAAADLGPNFQREVKLRLKADAPKTSRPAATQLFTLDAGP